MTATAPEDTDPVGIARPATYREVFAVPEFRPLFGTFLLSTAGDELARVALRQAGIPEIRALAETVIRFREEELRDWDALLARFPGR